MADFIQTFNLFENVVDFIMNKIKFNEQNDKIEMIEAEIPELSRPMNGMIDEFIKQISEYNYPFPKNKYYKFKTYLKRSPPHFFEHWGHEGGDYFFNFYIFLKDSYSIFEIFNPFTTQTVRIPVTKGLVVIFPSTWLILSRYTITLNSDSICIIGTTIRDPP